MFTAVKNGDAKELAELMRLDPGFKVNMVDGDGWTLFTPLALIATDPP